MANYYGQTRTNYFAVKDPEAFQAELKLFPVEVITTEGDGGETLYGFLDSDVDGSGYITEYWDEEANQSVEIDLEDFFKRHLVEGWVAIVIHTGAEKHRYLTGDAVAYNSKGESICVNLSDIYTLAEQLGDKSTTAEY